MDFWQTLVLSLVTSLLGGGASAAILAYVFQKKFDVHHRMMEMRKEKYTEVSRCMKGLFNTATPEERAVTSEKLPDYYRDLQVWASDNVVSRLTTLMKSLESKKSQENIDFNYREFIIAMRIDLLGKTKIKEADTFVIGKLN